MTEVSSINIEQCSPAVKKHTSAATPLPLRMMAAKGLAMMPPKDLIVSMYLLTFDTDDKIAKQAQQSLEKLDQRLANAVLSDASIHVEVLGYLTTINAQNDANLHKLLLNTSTPASAFAEVARYCSEASTELIANNQSRLLEEPQIAQSLYENDNASKATQDKAIDFLVRQGIVIEGSKAFEDALLRLGADERLQAVAHIEVPAELLDERVKQAPKEEKSETEDPLADLPLEEKIRRLPVPMLVAYATKGNKQVRKMLMRHSTRVVAVAAVSSPMTQEPDVIEAVNSRVTNQDVIAYVAKDKKNGWLKNYQIKLGLTTNPKTPLPIAMKLVSSLQSKDIKHIARSKNIPAGVRTLAQKLSRNRSSK